MCDVSKYFCAHIIEYLICKYIYMYEDFSLFIKRRASQDDVSMCVYMCENTSFVINRTSSEDVFARAAASSSKCPYKYRYRYRYRYRHMHASLHVSMNINMDSLTCEKKYKHSYSTYIVCPRTNVSSSKSPCRKKDKKHVLFNILRTRIHIKMYLNMQIRTYIQFLVSTRAIASSFNSTYKFLCTTFCIYI